MKEITIGDCRLFNGDCFDVLSKLELQADAIISDPPYGCTNCKWDKMPPLETMWELMEARTKARANFILFACGKFSIDLVNSKYGWYRYDWIWAKNNRVGFLNASKMPMRSHEQILVFGRPGHRAASTYNPQRMPGGRVGAKRTIRRTADGVYGYTNTCSTTSDGWMNPCSVLNFDSDRGNNQQGQSLHPTQKPVSLLEWLVLTYTNPGDLVIDPFLGSGTTALACARTGRRFLGIEREEKYFDLAIKRLQAPRTASLIEDEPPYLFQSRPTDHCKTDESQVHASNRRI